MGNSELRIRFGGLSRQRVYQITRKTIFLNPSPT